jgi:hypothetical protein
VFVAAVWVIPSLKVNSQAGTGKAQVEPGSQSRVPAAIPAQTSDFVVYFIFVVLFDSGQYWQMTAEATIPNCTWRDNPVKLGII